MSSPRRSANQPARSRTLLLSTRVALCALTLAVAFQQSGRAADDLLPADALPFSLSYTVTGDYAVATVDLLPEPDNADGDLGRLPLRSHAVLERAP